MTQKRAQKGKRAIHARLDEMTEAWAADNVNLNTFRVQSRDGTIPIPELELESESTPFQA